jgi:hypothetical protein
MVAEAETPRCRGGPCNREGECFKGLFSLASKKQTEASVMDFRGVEEKGKLWSISMLLARGSVNERG